MISRNGTRNGLVVEIERVERTDNKAAVDSPGLPSTEDVLWYFATMKESHFRMIFGPIVTLTQIFFINEQIHTTQQKMLYAQY